MTLICVFNFRSQEKQPVLTTKINKQPNIGICYFNFFAILLLFHDSCHTRLRKKTRQCICVCVGGVGDKQEIFFLNYLFAERQKHVNEVCGRKRSFKECYSLSGSYWAYYKNFSSNCFMMKATLILRASVSHWLVSILNKFIELNGDENAQFSLKWEYEHRNNLECQQEYTLDCIKQEKHHCQNPRPLITSADSFVNMNSMKSEESLQVVSETARL